MVPSQAEWELRPVPATWGAEDAPEAMPASLRVELEAELPLVIGRGDKDAGIVKIHRHISRRHAELVAERGRDDSSVLVVTAASSTHKIAVRRAPRVRLLREEDGKAEQEEEDEPEEVEERRLEIWEILKKPVHLRTPAEMIAADDWARIRDPHMRVPGPDQDPFGLHA